MIRKILFVLILAGCHHPSHAADTFDSDARLLKEWVSKVPTTPQQAKIRDVTINCVVTDMYIFGVEERVSVVMVNNDLIVAYDMSHDVAQLLAIEGGHGEYTARYAEAIAGRIILLKQHGLYDSRQFHDENMAACFAGFVK